MALQPEVIVGCKKATNDNSTALILRYPQVHMLFTDDAGQRLQLIAGFHRGRASALRSNFRPPKTTCSATPLPRHKNRGLPNARSIDALVDAASLQVVAYTGWANPALVLRIPAIIRIDGVTQYRVKHPRDDFVGVHVIARNGNAISDGGV